MKKIIFGFAIGIGCTLLLANSHERGTVLQSVAKDSTIDCSSLQPEELCPVETARQWKENYKKYEDSLYKASGQQSTPFASAFTFQTNDLLIALGLPRDTKTNHRHVRGYFGIDEKGESKIFFVGVDGADFKTNDPGTDVLFYCSKQRNIGQAFVLDLNYPCPTLCPTDPLLTAKAPIHGKKKK